MPGRQILFLPGLGGGSKQWDAMLDVLDVPSEWQITFGPSFADDRDPDGRAWHVRSLAGRICSELGRLGCEEVIVVAQSVSAFVALEIAANAPQLVRELVLVNGGLLTIVELLDRPLRTLVRHVGPCLVALRLFAMLGTPAPNSVKGWIASSRSVSGILLSGLVCTGALNERSVRDQLIMEESKPFVFSVLYANRHYHDFLTPTAQSVRARVSFLAGACDRLAPTSDTEEMAALFTNGHVTVFGSSAHAIPVEQPYDLADFLSEVIHRSQ